MDENLDPLCRKPGALAGSSAGTSTLSMQRPPPMSTGLQKLQAQENIPDIGLTQIFLLHINLSFCFCKRNL